MREVFESAPVESAPERVFNFDGSTTLEFCQRLLSDLEAGLRHGPQLFDEEVGHDDRAKEGIRRLNDDVKASFEENNIPVIERALEEIRVKIRELGGELPE